MAVHNRWGMTREILTKLDDIPSNIELCIHVVDDGSSDSTHTEMKNYPKVSYFRGNGDLFWAKSMKVAQDSVSDKVDYILWLNNDVILNMDFYARILQSINDFPKSILVGQTSDPITKQITYGGLKRRGRHPHRLEKIHAQTDYIEADTFCGNIVLVPNSINKAVGGIDGEFEHGYADYDFGYRAKKNGHSIVVIPGFLGTCSENPNLILNKSRSKVLGMLFSKKYLPFRSQVRFCMRHGGPEWPVYVLAPYLRALLGIKKYKSNQLSAGF